MSIFDLLKKRPGREGPATKPEWLLVGLGNPGRKYETTRHNVGFLTVDTLLGGLGCGADKLKFKSLCAQTAINGMGVLAMKPQTFMNNSGEAVAEAARFYKIPPERVLVVSDDITMEAGKVRVRQKGSDGGHNGLKSIILRLNSDAFPRIKIGVGAPPHEDYDAADWVLSCFEKSDMPAITTAIDRAVSEISKIIR